MPNQARKSLWVVNLFSMLSIALSLVAFWLLLPALLVVFGVNPVHPGRGEFLEAFQWGLPLMVLANLLAILVLKWSDAAYRSLVQYLTFSLTLLTDIGLVLLLVLG